MNPAKKKPNTSINSLTSKNTPFKGYWEVLTLRFVDADSPVWWNTDNQGVDIVPTGQLVNLDFQVREFNQKIEYKLLINLFDGENFLLLGMGLRTFSALSLLEPLCLLPSVALQVPLTLRHEVQVSGLNTYLKFLVELEGRVLNAPLSSLRSWHTLCFQRLAQLQRKLGQPSLNFDSLNSSEEF
jgi:hypothetical protein